MDKQQHSKTINELVAALSKAQSSVLKAKEDSKNPFFKSKYANLESVWDACRDSLTSNGIAVFQTIDHEDNKMILVTVLAHSSGQWIKSFSPIPNIKQDPQSIGSAITYMRRYSLAAIVGVATSDDDGEEATKPFRESPKPNKTKIKELKKLLENDEEFRTRINDYVSSSGYNSIEDLPEKVVDNAIKTLNRKVSDKKTVSLPMQKEA